MYNSVPVLEYKCPCCDAGLKFEADAQNLSCEYCGNSFDLDAVIVYNEDNTATESFNWTESESSNWTDDEQMHIQSFQCPSCGGEILTDDTTAATFCPYCENPAIMTGRVSGGLKPDAVIPFKTAKKDAQTAFLKLCKSKPLLPKDFSNQQRLEKITGMYVPFWLYNCSGNQESRYRATRVHLWSDSRHNYKRTDYYLLTRAARASFDNIPMDGSSKMDNAIMESIEPFDYTQMVDFETVYLSGYLADKYDVEHTAGKERIRQRVGSTLDDQIRASMIGYVTTIPLQMQLNIEHSKAKYVLLPVWMLHSRYKDKTYVFAMNGQSGKMTGTFPICPKRSAAWFAGICAGVAVVATLIQYLAL
ncbi:MAG: hypothetical protein IJF02_03715 [Oscillospiraceae bacterium]|nr:hypothetical protein [Oscillospiraceae bacterium]